MYRFFSAIDLPYIKIETVLSNLKKQHTQNNKFHLFANEKSDYDTNKDISKHGSIDDFDRSIIKSLYQDGRSTLTSIARGIKPEKEKKGSHVFVKRRIEKLIEKNIIKVQSNINLGEFRYFLTTFLIQTDNKEISGNILKKYDKCPRNLFSMEVYGKYDLILMQIAENIDILESLIYFCNPKNNKEVKNVDILISTSVSTPKYFPIQLFIKKKANNTPCDLSPEDCQSLSNDKCVGCPSSSSYTDNYTKIH